MEIGSLGDWTGVIIALLALIGFIIVERENFKTWLISLKVHHAKTEPTNPQSVKSQAGQNRRVRKEKVLGESLLITYRGRFYFVIIFGAFIGAYYYEFFVWCLTCLNDSIASLTDVVANGVIFGMIFGVAISVVEEVLFRLLKGELKVFNKVKLVEFIFIKTIDRVILSAILGLILITFLGLASNLLTGGYHGINDQFFWIAAAATLGVVWEFVRLFLHGE